MQAHPTTHLWCMSMQHEDMARLQQQRNHDSDNWRQVSSHFSKHGGGHEAAWTAYLEGGYPEYPVDILRHNHAQVYQRLAFMRDDQQDPTTYSDAYLQVRNPITVEGLVQLTMGAPLFMYNGGLLMARLRYFDPQRRRSGLPSRRGRLGGIARRRAGRPALGQPASDARARGLATGWRFWRA